ncbi:MAG: hypothetical protein CMB80_10785 [Flammeovirgaceae bacterium]|nr:hypothetical protein [Flammeovirgaceae bacterium]
MAEQPQTIVEPAAPVDKPLGARNQANLSAIFGDSPLPGYLGELTDEERKEEYQKTVLDGTVTAGFGFSNFNPEYTANGAPDLLTVETGGGGNPATPYVPNPDSPGPGSMSASDQSEFTGTIPESGPEYGSGLGGLVSPSTTSTEIEKQTLGGYISGKSYVGSNGVV